jgi:cytoskeletal protein CcmA (bactofilin family)
MDDEKDKKPELGGTDDTDASTAVNHDEPQPEERSSPDTQATPADALSRTPDELEELTASVDDIDTEAEEAKKHISPIKRFFRKINVYFLAFFVIMVVVAAITVVNYLNSQRAPETPDIASQQLSQDSLQQLANSDVSVGASSQTLTIQGNAIISGQTLTRGNLNVAGNFQSGGSIQGPSLTISGSSNLGEAQINSLQVATNTAVQGNTTLRDLNVSGTSSFGGAMTASQITVSRLIISGNGALEIPNHLSFTGPTPSRSVNSSALGAGGTVSVSGSDTAGVVNINTGNNPSAGCFTRVTFHQAFTSQPRVIISPISPAAGQTQYYVDRNNTGFSICTNTPAPGNQTFAFDYFVAN